MPADLPGIFIAGKRQALLQLACNLGRGCCLRGCLGAGWLEAFLVHPFMRETLALGTCVIMVRTSEMGGLGVKQTIAALGRSQTKAIIVFDMPAAQTG